jgi:hypothetical protein
MIIIVTYRMCAIWLSCVLLALWVLLIYRPCLIHPWPNTVQSSVEMRNHFENELSICLDVTWSHCSILVTREVVSGCTAWRGNQVKRKIHPHQLYTIMICSDNSHTLCWVLILIITEPLWRLSTKQLLFLTLLFTNAEQGTLCEEGILNFKIRWSTKILQ